MKCENNQSLYTYTANSFCDGWAGLSLKECKIKCTNNEVPNDKCPQKDCAYVSHNSDWGCHLGDETCKPIKGGKNYTLLRKEGKNICYFYLLTSFPIC